MQFSVEKFKNMPSSAKMGAALWLFGWIWLLVVYYYLTKDTNWVVKLSIAMVVLGVFLFHSQNWARMICVLSNLMGMLISVLFFFKGYVFIAGVNIALFGAATYFLMIPATGSYFKAQGRPSSPSDDR